MAVYDANGNYFSNKSASRVSYDLLIYSEPTTFSSEDIPGLDIPDAYKIGGEGIILG